MIDGFQASGSFDQGTYTALTYQVHMLGLNGVLRLQYGNRQRELFYISGLPVLFKSTLPEEQLTKTLVFGNVISKSRLNKALARVDERTSLEEVLLKSRQIRRTQLDHHLKERMQKGIGAPLHWSNGDWTFQAYPHLEEVRIDLDLIPQFSVLNSLWDGVKRHISVDAVMKMVRENAPASRHKRKAAPKIWTASADLEAQIAHFELEAPFDRVTGVLLQGGSPDQILSKVEDGSGNLVKLLWLLENIGLLVVEDSEPGQEIADLLTQASRGEAPTQAQPEEETEPSPDTAPSQKKKRKRAASAKLKSLKRSRQAATSPSLSSSRNAIEALENDHRSRLNTNYYEFLSLRPDCSKEEIEHACKRLAQRWRSAANSHLLEERSRQQAKELLGGVRQVWNVLKDESERTGYDRNLSLGKAPVVRTETATELNQILGDLPGAPVGSDSVEERDESFPNLLKQGQAYLEGNHFQAAWQVLEKARQEDPSCPDTLAALGWAAYHVKHQARLEEDPEDFLRLALTFDPNHVEALEYHARISLKKGELERAESLLSHLTKLKPKATWAQRELSQIRSAQSRDKSTRRFWRKGDD